MAVAALLLWLCTAAVGTYLLATAPNSRNAEPETMESVPVSAEQPSQAPPLPGPVKPLRDRDRWDPPSLQRAKSEPPPGMKALAEFAHPALAMIGLACWLGYVVSRDRLFFAIGLGILLGAICAGLSWFIANARAARRASAATAADGSAAGGSAAESRSSENPGNGFLLVSPRLLILHGIGAALTLLFVAWTAARA